MSTKLKQVNSQGVTIVTAVNECLQMRKAWRGQKIGFVPTMGHLHRGHLNLCERSMAENEKTVVSIFVNPTQFNEKNDFDAYPRTLQSDIEKLSLLGVDCLFLPDKAALYPDDYQVQVIETSISQILEGEYRPGHFAGMLSIILKLFHLVSPSHAYFGEKDYQQCLLVKKLVDAFFLPIKIIACETIRDEHGLALSSRNSRLSEADLKIAPHLYRLLRSEASLDAIRMELISLGFKVDYLAEKWGRRLAAVWLNEVRLIDNVPL